MEVRVTVDGFGTGTLPAAIAATLDAAGAAWRVYRPVRGFRLQRRYLRRLHRKVAVIDDEVAFVGGINIIDDLNHTPFRDDALGARYDFAVRVRGPLVSQIALMVDRLWWQMGLRTGMREVGVTGVAAEFPVMTDTPKPRRRGASGPSTITRRATCWRRLCCATTCATAAPSNASTCARWARHGTR